MSAILDPIGEEGAQKPSEKGYLVDAEAVRKTLKILT